MTAPPRDDVPPKPVVRPLPGDGLVAREGDLSLVCARPGPAAPAVFVDRLLAALADAAAAGEGGRELVGRVIRVLSTADDGDSGPLACAAAGPAPDGGVAVLVGGGAEARVLTSDGRETRIDGTASYDWTERTVSGPIARLDLVLPGAGEVDPRLRLSSGVVHGGGLRQITQTGRRVAGVLPMPASAARPNLPEPKRSEPKRPEAIRQDATRVESSAEPPRTRIEHKIAPSASPSPSASPGPGLGIPVAGAGAAARPKSPTSPRASSPGMQGGAGLSVSPSASPSAAPAAKPGSGSSSGRSVLEPPHVLGVNCKNHHFNDPRARYCAVCGISMMQATLAPFKGPRPPLGVLLVDDGQTVPLVADLLIGREPRHAPEVAEKRAMPMRLTDDDGSISRRHTLISLDGWQVRLVDLGSVNGTAVKLPHAADFERIAADTPVPLAPGTVARIGVSRTFRFESNREP
ncbi:FHA domain-containing protein [Spirillospora sp. NPDC052269]